LSVGQAISSGTLVITPSTLSQSITLSPYVAGYITAGTGTLATGTVVINTSAVTANSKIFLTNTLATNRVSVGTIVPNTSFQVTGTNVDTFTWLIIN